MLSALADELSRRFAALAALLRSVAAGRCIWAMARKPCCGR